MEKPTTETYNLLKQLYQHVYDEYNKQPVSPELIKKSLNELRHLKLPIPQSKQGKELYALVSEAIKQYFVLSKNGQLSPEEGSVILRKVIDFFVADQELAKEEKEKKENELHAQIQEAVHRKLQQIIADTIEVMKQRIKESIEEQERLEKNRKEEEEKKRLLALALAALRKLFEELENSLSFTQVTLDNGMVIDIHHRDIFKLADYRSLYKDYVSGEIGEELFNRRRQTIGQLFIESIARQHGSGVSPSEVFRVISGMDDTEKNAVNYRSLQDAMHNLKGVKIVREVKDEISGRQKHHIEKHVQETENVYEEKLETKTEKLETKTEKIEAVQEKENVDVESKNLVENIDETVSTDIRDELDDLLGDLDDESMDLEAIPSTDMLPVVEKIMGTLKSVAELEKKAAQIKNKIENKQEPGEDNKESPPRPSF